MLVQVDEYKKSDAIFDKDYACFSSFSTSWLAHTEKYVEMISKLLHLNKNSFVIEITSNDGYLLQYFKKRRMPCLGIEPTNSTAKVAKENGIEVLEPLSGYLMLGEKLFAGKKEFADGWNFGPENESSITVQKVVEAVKKYWDDINYMIEKVEKNLHEANLLKLDCSKANTLLEWRSVWDSATTFKKTVTWYKAFYQDEQISALDNLQDYITEATKKKLAWTI